MVNDTIRPSEQRASASVFAPVRTGVVERGGVRVSWEELGGGERTILLLPTWSIVPSAHWKFQAPFLARRHRVLTFDGRGSGRSDRPVGAEHYTVEEFAADALAVLDATGTERAVLGALSCGALWALELAARHPQRVAGLFVIGPAVGLAPGHPEREVDPFDAPLGPQHDGDGSVVGWASYNAAYWRRDYRAFTEFFAGRMFTEPHSTKAHEDFVEWADEIGAERLIDSDHGIGQYTVDQLEQAVAAVRCPVRVIHGSDDAIRPHAQGAALAEATGGELVTIVGGGHAPHLRDPVAVNHLFAEFVDALAS